jgi:hypothetical protein
VESRLRRKENENGVTIVPKEHREWRVVYGEWGMKRNYGG